MRAIGDNGLVMKREVAYEGNGLSINMKHYVRAYSSNPKGLSYGPESTFTTTDERDGINGDGGTIGKDGWDEDEDWNDDEIS